MQFTYSHGDKTLVLEPLKGQIDPDASDFTVGKAKVEIRLVKRVQGRWGDLVGDSPDGKYHNFLIVLQGNLYIYPHSSSQRPRDQSPIYKSASEENQELGGHS